MSNAEANESNTVRLSRWTKDRLKEVAKRDGFSLGQALETVVTQALTDLESGQAKFGTSVNPNTED